MGRMDAVAPCLRCNRVNSGHSNWCTNGYSLGMGRPVLRTACHDNNNYYNNYHDHHHNPTNNNHNPTYDDYFDYFDYFDNYNINYNYDDCTGVALTH